MLRKHINSLPRPLLDNLPFYSWNCITIQLVNRDIDLVIRDLKDMKLLLKLLVYKMKTLDGTKNSGKKLLDLLTKNDVKEFMRVS